jgi:hypothetical protein
MTLEKSARFLFSLLGFDGEIEGDKRMFREQAEKGGGFAGLSGPGNSSLRCSFSVFVASIWFALVISVCGFSIAPLLEYLLRSHK